MMSNMSQAAWQGVGILPIIIISSLLAYVGYTLYVALFSPYARLPGPLIARYSNLWRIRTVLSGQAPYNFQKLHEQYGPLVRTGPTHVSVSDSSLIPVIYGISSKFTKSGFYNGFSPVIGNKLYSNIFACRDQEVHRKLKSGVAQKYSLSSLLSLEPLVDKVTQQMITKLRDCSENLVDKSQNSTIVDLGKYLQYYAFDVIGSITFSKTFGFIESGYDRGKVIEGIDFGLLYNSVVGQVPILHKFLLGNPLVSKVMESIPAIEQANPIPIVYRMITHAISTSTVKSDDDEGQDVTHEDFLTFLRKQNLKDSQRMTEDDMVGHMFVNLLAGSDTTAISLRTIIYGLLKNPRIYLKLKSEIDTADAASLLSPVITYAETQAHLPYLALVIKEALRIHPAVALPLERLVPSGGATMNDYFLPEGTSVGVNAWVVQYDKAVFGSDAATFRPERWESINGLDETERLKKMERSFFAFGHGARSCIGKNISLLEMSKFIPQLLREFDLEWAGDEEWETSSNWFMKQTGVFVRCKSRVKQ